MKKIVFSLVIVIIFVSCASAPPMSEANRLFMQETQLSLAIPMRFYYWVKVDNANRVMPDENKET